MRKLLLLTVILFGMINIKGLAAGCNAQVCICPNGGYVSYGEYCSPTYNNSSSSSTTYFIRAFAYDKDSGAYGEGKGETYDEGSSKKNAKKQALTNCGTKNCKIIAFGRYRSGGIVVASSNGILIGDNYSTDPRGLPEESYEKAKEKLIKKCKDMSGTNCKVLWDTNWGFRE